MSNRAVLDDSDNGVEGKLEIKRKVNSSNAIIKSLALGSLLSLTVSMTACSLPDTYKTSSAKAKEPPKENEKKAAKSPTHYSNGDKKPNVVYIVFDDIGFSDIGAYGSEIKTPNIDKLAADGLIYNNFNTTPLCSPTRASLLTGREHNSVGMGYVAEVALDSEHPNFQGRITPEAGTIAEMLQENGYSTFAIGKWHVAPAYTVTPAGPFNNWPLSKGFDRFYGFLAGETDQFHPQLVNGNEMIPLPKAEGYNLNDDLLTHAKQQITDQISIYPDKPFFMNYAFGTAHSPLQVPKKYIDKYDGVYDKGWNVIREERFNRQKNLGIVPKNATLPPSDSRVKPWENLSADQKKLFARFMETYAGYVTQADEEVGMLVSYLKEIGEYDNTMFVLIGDNGATDVGGPEGTDSFISAASLGREATAEELMLKYNLIGGSDMQALYPTGWGQASNTPFRGFKFGVYNGALRNPLIISWPKGIKDKGSIRSQYVHVTDITPTVLDVLDFKAPKVLKGVKQMPMYGTSIKSTFEKDNTSETRDSAISFLSPNRAIYHKGWKAIATHKFGTSFDQDVWELYKVSDDYTEFENLADKYPDKLKELQKLFKSEAEKLNILPLQEVSPRDGRYISEDSPANRATFKYYPGAGSIYYKASPQVGSNSFTISVPVTRGNVETSGVLVAMGDETGGYTFYIKDNKLVFLYNKFGEISKITSNIDVPIGKSELKFDFNRTSMNGGNGTLYINGKKVGEGAVQTAPTITLEVLSFGKDEFKSVGKEYNGEFAFSGKFDYIQFDMTKFVPQK